MEGNKVKNVRNLFKLKKENKAIKERAIRDIKNMSELEKDYYRPVRAHNFYSNKDIEQESNGDRNKTLLIKEYLNKVKAYLEGIKNDITKYET